MKTVFFAFSILFFFIFFSPTLCAQGWTQIDDFPSTARDDGASFIIGNIAYCGTGVNTTWTPTNDFYALNLSTDSWSPITELPINEARQYSNGFASDTHGYLFGGINSTGYLNDLWKYDPLADSWGEVSPMPSIGRSGASCFVIGDTAYILGGRTQNNVSIAEFWAYSISGDVWTQKNPLPDSLWRASAISYQGKGYLVFGANNGGVFKNDAYAYDPSTGSWTVLSSFPGVGRIYGGISVLDDHIVLVTGRDSLGNSYNDMWIYSTISDTWTLSENLPSDQRRGGFCFSSNTALYYSAGINLNDVRLTETWKYDLFLSTSEEDVGEFTLYPNPAKECIKVHFRGAIDFSHFEIATIDGKILLSGEVQHEGIIPIDELSSGNYLITIQTESKSTTKKLMIL